MKYLLITLEVREGEKSHTHRNLYMTNATNVGFIGEYYAARYWGHATRDNKDAWWYFDTLATRLLDCVELTAKEYMSMQKIFSGNINVVKHQMIISDDDRQYYKIYAVNPLEDIVGEHLFEGSLTECVVFVKSENIQLINVDEVDDWIVAQSEQNSKKIDIESILVRRCFDLIGISTPNNIDVIVDYVYDYICENADEINWNNTDVIMGFHFWIESHNEGE